MWFDGHCGTIFSDMPRMTSKDQSLSHWHRWHLHVIDAALCSDFQLQDFSIDLLTENLHRAAPKLRANMATNSEGVNTPAICVYPMFAPSLSPTFSPSQSRRMHHHPLASPDQAKTLAICDGLRFSSRSVALSHFASHPLPSADLRENPRAPVHLNDKALKRISVARDKRWSSCTIES